MTARPRARFRAGNEIAMREVYRGRVWHATAMTVVRDDEELVALFAPAGAERRRPRTPDGTPMRLATGDWVLEETTWEGSDALHLVPYGAPYAVVLFWERAGTGREFSSWYINIQEPLSRSAVGFDRLDRLLDVVLSADLREWHWKDEDELELAVELGVWRAEEAAAFRAEAERVIAERPWPTGWEDWRPPDEWQLPELPHDWRVV